MAGSNQITNKIVLEGEAEYKKSLDAINRSLKESKSALKAAAAEYDGAEDSMVAMYKQGDALERVLRDQEAALRLMEGQLDKVEGAYGRNSREATELRTKINNMRTEMARTESQIRQFAQQMDDARDAMDGGGSGADEIGEAIGKIGTDAEGAQGGVGGLLDMLKQVSGVDLKSLGIAGVVGGAAALGGKAFADGMELGNEVLESWNQLAAYTGLTGDALERVKNDAQAVYQSGVGDSLMDVTNATAQIYQLTGVTGTSLQECTTYAMALSETFGMDVNESARTAAVLMNEFGISGREAYDLIAAGAQGGADKNGNLLDTINEYAPYFKDAGKGADEMFNAIITGAQSGVYDVDKIGDAWKEFMLRVTSGDEGPQQALKDLGFAAEDVATKIAAGGPAADLATQEIITALSNVKDPYEQNRLAIELFGTQWEDTNGKVLPIFEGMQTGLDGVKGTAQGLADIKYDDLDTAWQNLTRSIEALASPTLAAGASALADTFDRWAGAVDRVAQGDWKGAVEELVKPSAEAQAQAAAAQEASAGLREELAALDAEINAAFMAGDNVTGWTLTAQREQLLAEIQKIELDAVAAMGQAGTNTATALEGTSGDMQTAAQAVGETAVTAIEDAQPDMMDAADDMGSSAELGLKAGASGMYDAGKDAADGAVDGMGTGVSAAYSKGYATGQAYERGYRAATDTHSPSRVMIKAAHDTVDGLLVGFEEDEARLYDAAAGLGEVLTGGVAGGFAAGGGGIYAGGGADVDVMAAAMRQALMGLAWDIDGERFATLIEPGVSQETSRRAAATVQGQAAAVKGW